MLGSNVLYDCQSQPGAPSLARPGFVDSVEPFKNTVAGFSGNAYAAIYYGYSHQVIFNFGGNGYGSVGFRIADRVVD